MLRFKVYLGIPFLVLGSLAFVALSSPLRAQSDPMAQWKPSVGDRFVYLMHSQFVNYWHGLPNGTSNYVDTFYEEIVNTDSNYDSTHQHVVVTREYFPKDTTPLTLFYDFHAGRNSGSIHPFAITEGDTLCTKCGNADYDFSIASDTEIAFDSTLLNAYFSQYDTTTAQQNGLSDYLGSIAIYSPQLRWFCFFSSSDNEPPPDETYTGTSGNSTLLFASNFQSKVDELPLNSPVDVTVDQTGNLLSLMLWRSGWEHSSISLLDPLGRSIRSWQLPVGAGERQITLNIADVPSGVYFLRVSGEGIDEVKKVCITH
ncbi:MAG TPA: hypothetical protein VFD13_05715 [Candidatus Kapabacteria bacterium]|nr:hypothetical protein [Candidatus Kapabacteria bacterium]